MELQSLFSEVIPTMIFAWIFLLISIGFSNLGTKIRQWLRNMAKNASDPSYVREKVSVSERIEKFYSGFKTTWLAAPNNISMAIKSAWRARERGLAIFAGVFLSSLVITTVLAYAVGLNQGFFQFLGVVHL